MWQGSQGVSDPFGTFRNMASCQRPTCGREQAGILLSHYGECRVELLPLGDPTGDRYGTALCAVHLERASVPKGWTLTDLRAAPAAVSGGTAPTRPRTHGAPGSSTNPDRARTEIAGSGQMQWGPLRGREVPDAVASVRSPLLRRAFLGDEIPDGFTGIERSHHEVDGDPEGLAGGMRHDGDDHGDSEWNDREPQGVDVGPQHPQTDQHADQDQAERQDRAHDDRAQEVAGVTLEAEPTAGARLAESDEPAREPALATHATGPGEASPEEATVGGGISGLHDDEPTVGQLRLAV